MNKHNSSKPKSNTSGYCGVTWHKQNGKWQATIMSGGKFHYLGSFTTIEEAASVRADKARELGFSNRHGIAHSPHNQEREA